MVDRRRFLLGASLFAGTAVLEGCGFHLRGKGGDSLGFGIQTLTLKGVSVYSGFGRRLANSIEANGIKLIDDGKVASAVLNISAPSRRRDVLSVDSTVYAREYSLVTSSRFKISYGEQSPEEDLEWQKLEVRRDLLVDPNDILGSDYEAERLNNEMEQELVDLLIFRLRAVSSTK